MRGGEAIDSVIADEEERERAATTGPGDYYREFSCLSAGCRRDGVELELGRLGGRRTVRCSTQTGHRRVSVLGSRW